MPLFADSKDELSLLLTAPSQSFEDVVEKEKKVCDEKKVELKKRQFEYMKLTKKLIDGFNNKMNNELLDVNAVKANDFEKEKIMDGKRA